MLKMHEINMRHSQYGRKFRRTQWIAGSFAVLAIIGGMVKLAQQGPSREALSNVIIFSIVGGFMVILPMLVRRYLLKDYARRPDRDMMVYWEFYSDRITVKNEASSGTFEWRLISRILQVKEGFLFYKGDHLSNWLPVHAFQTESDKEAFIFMARSNVPQFDNNA